MASEPPASELARGYPGLPAAAWGVIAASGLQQALEAIGLDADVEGARAGEVDGPGGCATVFADVLLVGDVDFDVGVASAFAVVGGEGGGVEEALVIGFFPFAEA